MIEGSRDSSSSCSQLVSVRIQRQEFLLPICFGNNFSYSILPLATSRALSRRHCFVSTFEFCNLSGVHCTVRVEMACITCCQAPCQFFREGSGYMTRPVYKQTYWLRWPYVQNCTSKIVPAIGFFLKLCHPFLICYNSQYWTITNRSRQLRLYYFYYCALILYKRPA